MKQNKTIKFPDWETPTTVDIMSQDDFNSFSKRAAQFILS